MSAESNSNKQLMRLCGLMVDGGLDDADMERLSELLTSDAAAREFYRGYMDAHARLLLHFEPVPVFDEQYGGLPGPSLSPASTGLEAHRTRPPTSASSWWSFAAAAALLLLVGLNAIQSAGNLEAARTSNRPATMPMTDVEVQRLADVIGLPLSDVKRMAMVSSKRE